MGSESQQVDRSGRKVRSILSLYVNLQSSNYITRRVLVRLASCSFAGSLLEAGTLFLIIRLALALSGDESTIALDVGPLDTAVPVSVSFGVAGAMLLVAASLGWATASLTARVATDAIDRARRDTATAFLEARWEIQSREVPSRVQELLSTHVIRLGTGAVILCTATVALVNLATYLLSALLVSPMSALLMLCGGSLFAAGAIPLTRVTRRRSQEVLRLNSEYSDAVSQTVTLAQDIRVLNVEDRVRDDLLDLSRRQARSGYSTRLLAKFTPVAYQMVALALLLACLAGAYAFSVGDMSSLSVIIVLLVRAISYGQQLNSAVQQSSDTSPYIDALSRTLTVYRSARVSGGSIPTPAIQHLELRNVSMAYGGGENVLHQVSLSASAGEMIAIVGPSGSGKSSLSQILLRLREPTSGEMLINGIPAGNYELSSWFDRTAFVPQENRLLPGTVAENIRFYRELAEDVVASSARLSNLHDEIKSMPDQYDTMIGPGAADLSGGQRQRLGLARALAGKPDLIVLDEPTSALDMRSEALVQQTLARLKGEVICFIIAHRLSTIAACDRVIVLEDGRVTAMGSPDEVELANTFFGEAAQLSRGGGVDIQQASRR